MVLGPSEYDASYFDGKSQAMSHNAGYAKYERWFRHDGVDSKGEYYKDLAATLNDRHKLPGNTVLEVGCAKGFIVQDLRDLGIDCHGLDVSQYAFDQSDAVVQPFLTVADARTYLSNFANKKWDVLFSLRFLECIEDAEISDLLAEFRRVSKRQFHVIDEAANASFYNNHPLSFWAGQGFPKNTRLYSRETSNEVRI